MFPVVSHFGLDLPVYPLLLFAGLVLSWILIYRRTSKLGWPTVGVVTILLLGFPVGAVGGRALASATESILGSGAQPGAYAGMTVLGSIVAVLVFAAITVPRLVRVPLLEFLDAVAFSMPLSFVFGRTGCLALGCCHGSAAPADAPSWLTLPLSAYAVGTAPHQLFGTPGVETIWNLPQLFIAQAILVLVVVEVHYKLTKNRGPKGGTIALCLLLDALGRTFIEPYRGGVWGLQDTSNPWGLLTWVYLGILIALYVGLWGRWLRARPR